MATLKDVPFVNGNRNQCFGKHRANVATNFNFHNPVVPVTNVMRSHLHEFGGFQEIFSSEIFG